VPCAAHRGRLTRC